MRDRDIRHWLRQELVRTHMGEKDTLVLDELGLCQGAARVDLAVINGSLNGYEIKSERDTLERLPGQEAIYSKTLDSVTIVAGGTHIDKITEIVPDWWGIKEAAAADEGICFNVLREATKNPNVDPFSLVQLLWRDEVLAVLKERGLDKGVTSKPRRFLWQKLADSLTLAELSALVREKLKFRENWRSGQSQMLDDA